nr:hypothetical protein [Paraburkholderia sp. BCC1884]
MKAGSFESCLCKVGTGQLGRRKIRVFEPCVNEARVARVGTMEYGAGQIGVGEICPIDVRLSPDATSKARTAALQTARIRTEEIGEWRVYLIHDGMLECSGLKIAMRHLRGGEVGAAQVRSDELTLPEYLSAKNLAREIGFAEYGVVEMRACKVHCAQIGSVEKDLAIDRGSEAGTLHGRFIEERARELRRIEPAVA